jgi:uncharacterized protein YlxW (UPF0749 family)
MKLALLLSALAASAVPVPRVEFLSPGEANVSPDEVNAAAATLASVIQALQEEADRMAERVLDAAKNIDATQAAKEANAGVAGAVGSGDWAGSGSVNG